MYIKIIIFILAVLNSYVTGHNDTEKPTDIMIAEEGYPVEIHYVTTSDGYILCLHRIPTGKNGESNKKVVLLQHGLMMSSADWILFGPGYSLGYILADLGYDVWIGNSRGNKYSRNHTKYNPNTDHDFWKFSWHEMGVYDTPAIIDYMINVTRVDSIYYAGHSQGTTSFYVMGSEKPEYNAKIKVQISLAPIAYMCHMTSPLVRIMAFGHEGLELLQKSLGLYEFLPSTGFIHSLSKEFCINGIGPILCENALFAIAGFSYPEMDISRLPLIMGHTPAGSATRQILHYLQEIRSSCKFRQYDFGLGNLKIYNQLFPSNYNISKITAPVYLIYSKNDWMAGEIDVDRLYGELPNAKGKLLIPEKTFNHLDFLYGINAPTFVYKDVVNILSQY